VVRADAGWVNYQSERPLGYGLGAAQGSTNGAVFSGQAGPGDVIRLAPFTFRLQAGGALPMKPSAVLRKAAVNSP